VKYKPALIAAAPIAYRPLRSIGRVRAGPGIRYLTIAAPLSRLVVIKQTMVVSADRCLGVSIFAYDTMA
jgi:hypothetical protein